MLEVHKFSQFQRECFCSRELFHDLEKNYNLMWKRYVICLAFVHAFSLWHGGRCLLVVNMPHLYVLMHPFMHLFKGGGLLLLEWGDH